MKNEFPENRENKVLLEVQNLRTYFPLEEGVLKAVDDVSFTVQKGEILGLVGESGCGKSMTAHSILKLTPASARITGRIILHQNGKAPIDIVQLPAHGKQIRNIRGNYISMIFQEPMTALSPVHTIGSQIMEAILIHNRGIKKKEAERQTIEMLGKVGIPNASQRFREYPRQLSGGLRQRATIAMALSTSPSMVIADEPTTALDVTIQAQILKLMKTLQSDMGLSILYITHSLPVIYEIADRVAVMYLGKIVEYGQKESIFRKPLHPYTKALLKAIPRAGQKAKHLHSIKGTVPLPLELPEQCNFHARCERVIKGKCDKHVPQLIEVEKGHGVRCYLYEDESQKQTNK